MPYISNKEASDIIETALNKVVSENPEWENGDMLVEWVVVAYVTNPESEKGSSYPMYFSNGEIPGHRARGLLTTGLMYLNVGGEE